MAARAAIELEESAQNFKDAFEELKDAYECYREAKGEKENNNR